MPAADLTLPVARYTIYVCPQCERLFTSGRASCAGRDAFSQHPLSRAVPTEVVPAEALEAAQREAEQIVWKLGEQFKGERERVAELEAALREIASRGDHDRVWRIAQDALKGQHLE